MGSLMQEFPVCRGQCMWAAFFGAEEHPLTVKRVCIRWRRTSEHENQIVEVDLLYSREYLAWQLRRGIGGFRGGQNLLGNMCWI